MALSSHNLVAFDFIDLYTSAKATRQPLQFCARNFLAKDCGSGTRGTCCSAQYRRRLVAMHNAGLHLVHFFYISVAVRSSWAVLRTMGNFPTYFSPTTAFLPYSHMYIYVYSSPTHLGNVLAFARQARKPQAYNRNLVLQLLLRNSVAAQREDKSLADSTRARILLGVSVILAERDTAASYLAANGELLSLQVSADTGAPCESTRGAE